MQNQENVDKRVGMERTGMDMEAAAKMEQKELSVYEQIIGHIGMTLETMDKEIAVMTRNLEVILVPEKSADIKPDLPAAPQDHVPSSLETKLSALAAYGNQTMGRFRALSERIVM